MVLESAESLHLQGLEAAQKGLYREAAAAFREAIGLSPEQAAYHANLGLALGMLENYAEAIPCYRTALLLRPRHAGTLAKLGRALTAAGCAEEAVIRLREAIGIEPDNPDTHNALGAALGAAGRAGEAADAFETALALDGTYEEARANLTAVLLSLGDSHAGERRWEQAEAFYRRATRISPATAAAHYNLAVCLTALTRRAEALRAYELTLLADPASTRALNNLALLLHADGDDSRAIACYRRAIELDPGYIEARYNLGVTLNSLELPEQAQAVYQDLLALSPGHADTLNNLGGIALAGGRISEAIAHYQTALAAAPQHADAGWNLGLAKLSLGDFEQGWEQYELRLGQKNFPARSFPAPRWQGEELAGKTLLVWAEQGLGDTLQFVRYCKLAAARGARIALECQARLKPLLACLDGIVQLTARGDEPPGCDFHSPLLSLPRLFETRLDSIPPPASDWKLPPERLEKWRRELSRYAGRKVGLCWAGHPGNAAGRKRSAPLAVLSRLAAVPGLTLFSLQRGPQAAELAGVSGIVNLEYEDNDIVDTAAIVAGLDLVITVDTMTAHLAGTLGRPVWTLLPFAADWRWLTGRDDSPWYPSMRLFRQQRPGDWEELAARLERQLSCA